MWLVSQRSEDGKFTLCRGDDKTAQWTEFYPPAAGSAARERRQVCLYRDGKAEGVFTSWHPGGKRWVEGAFHEGQKAGLWNQWNKEGIRVADGTYRDGLLTAGAPVGMVARCESITP
jgi:hypothetical protein